MKLLVFAASNSAQSINRQLATYAATFVEGAEIEVLDINDYEMPLYSSDREAAGGVPALAQAFFDKIGSADALIVAFAEHNGSYTAAYKNLFDWTSRIDQKVFQGKQAVYLATSPGPGGAQSVLGAAVTSAPYFAAEVKGSLSIPSFYDNFDLAEQRLTNSELQAQLRETVASLTTETAKA